FDLVATVTFVHNASGQTHTTEMFYDGDDTWKFRFTGTRTGLWTFTTSSSDADLDDKSGNILINPNPGVPGFIKNFDNKWGRMGTEEAFVPQFVMYDDPSLYYNNPDKIDNDIQTFFVEHGFNGFHTNVFCRWFDIDEPRSDNIDVLEPDPRTFEALELLLMKVHEAGGVVHIWAWGDEQRKFTPVRWGLNGTEDKRLQRYIAARLGPIPGWSMGYGFDLDEWVTLPELQEWHDYMQSHLGWSHFLGGRPDGPDGTDHSEFIDWNDDLDYSSYEHHRPTYEVYVAALENLPDQPVFSEDRFRMRDEGNSKDYNMEDTRRGLWHSTMAGGVANIWANLLSGGSGFGGSDPYPNPEWIKTNSEFFKNRFHKDVVRDNDLTNGVCLKRPTNLHYLFYKEDVSAIEMDLSEMVISQPAIAVDAKQPYAEIDLGTLALNNQTWNAPYKSDWAIAVGDFDNGILETVTFEFPVEGGAWYFISLPVIPSDISVEAVFPTAIAAFEWNFTNRSYAEVSELQPQKGYWLLMPESATVEVEGVLLDSYTKAYTEPGWDIIGSVFSSSALIDEPESALLAMFGWDPLTGSYFRIHSAVVEPRQAYWILVFDVPSTITIGEKNMSTGTAVSVPMDENLTSFYKTHGKLPPEPPFEFVALDAQPIPQNFALKQNYPNPFNPNTIIEYQVPERTWITLEIYTILGQKVRTLVDGERQAGRHRVKWDGTNDDAIKTGSGIYLYRIQAGDFV
ncbi:DUF5060 domain-containing protein, partial [candidate division KSB1 bacterium]|nr:DUF5060 domain-containing protein [candidate division KSB1 bacterium]